MEGLVGVVDLVTFYVTIGQFLISAHTHSKNIDRATQVPISVLHV